jgi:hypothetical protein
LATVLGSWYKFLPHLGFIFFPFDFTDLQVHKPASADLINSQFIRNWREIDPDFLPGLFDAGARVLPPTGAHRALKRFFSSVLSAHRRGNAPLSTQWAAPLNQNLHCKLLDVGKFIPLVKMIMCKL